MLTATIRAKRIVVIKRKGKRRPTLPCSAETICTEAYKNIGNINVPIIVRLQGTNSKKAAEIINNSGLKVFSAITLQDAADKINDIL